MRVPPIGRDNEILLSWLGDESLHGLGAVYDVWGLLVPYHLA